MFLFVYQRATSYFPGTFHHFKVAPKNSNTDGNRLKGWHHLPTTFWKPLNSKWVIPPSYMYGISPLIYGMKYGLWITNHRSDSWDAHPSRGWSNLDLRRRNISVVWLRCVRSERWPCGNRLLSLFPVHEISRKTSRNPIVRNTWISMVITTHCLNPSCWWLNYNRFSNKPKYHMISLWSHSISSISQRWQPL